MRDYKVTIKIRNNYLLTAMKANGINTAAQLSRASGVGQVEIGLYLNLKKAPFSSRGLRPGVEKISKCLKVPPECLFPEQHLTHALERNATDFELDIEQVKTITGNSDGIYSILQNKERVRIIDEYLNSLPARDAEIVRGRFGFEGKEMTLDELAKKHNISSERVRHIESRALRRLKDRDKKKKLLRALI